MVETQNTEHCWAVVRAKPAYFPLPDNITFRLRTQMPWVKRLRAILTNNTFPFPVLHHGKNCLTLGQTQHCFKKTVQFITNIKLLSSFAHSAFVLYTLFHPWNTEGEGLYTFQCSFLWYNESGRGPEEIKFQKEWGKSIIKGVYTCALYSVFEAIQ